LRACQADVAQKVLVELQQGACIGASAKNTRRRCEPVIDETSEPHGESGLRPIPICSLSNIMVSTPDEFSGRTCARPFPIASIIREQRYGMISGERNPASPETKAFQM
jgi:hypothetical protein